MLGWHISVFRQTDGGASPAESAAGQGTRVAVWQAGPWGLGWIDDLVKEGKVVSLGGNGYPFRYTAQAEQVLPRITAGPPEARDTWAVGPHDILGPPWEGQTVIDRVAADGCRADEWLLIVAWDES